MSDYSIDVDNLEKSYGSTRALRGVSFRITPGEIVGFLGPNGAGKTTAMKILTCFMAADAGTARIVGIDVHDDSQGVRKRIGYLPENVPLYDDMMVFDYLMFIAEVRGVPANQRKARIQRVAEQTGLEQMLARDIFELSKGYRQRVGLAQAIIHEPDVVVLDEPTTGLDPNQIIEIRDVIKDIGQQKTVIFSTHILQEVTAVCDRIIIIDEGEIIADGTLGELEKMVSSRRPGLEVSFSDRDTGAKAALRKLDGVNAVRNLATRDGAIGLRVDTTKIAAVRKLILEAASAEGFELLSIAAVEPTLEDIFRDLTGGTSKATPSTADDASAEPEEEPAATTTDTSPEPDVDESEDAPGESQWSKEHSEGSDAEPDQEGD